MNKHETIFNLQTSPSTIICKFFNCLLNICKNSLRKLDLGKYGLQKTDIVFLRH